MSRREGERDGEKHQCERIDWLPLACTLAGTTPASQACALTGIWVLKPVSFSAKAQEQTSNIWCCSPLTLLNLYLFCAYYSVFYYRRSLSQELRTEGNLFFLPYSTQWVIPNLCMRIILYLPCIHIFRSIISHIIAFIFIFLRIGHWKILCICF